MKWFHDVVGIADAKEFIHLGFIHDEGRKKNRHLRFRTDDAGNIESTQIAGYIQVEKEKIGRVAFKFEQSFGAGTKVYDKIIDGFKVKNDVSSKFVISFNIYGLSNLA